jgi:hypothetical protein
MLGSMATAIHSRYETNTLPWVSCPMWMVSVDLKLQFIGSLSVHELCHYHSDIIHLPVNAGQVISSVMSN